MTDQSALFHEVLAADATQRASHPQGPVAGSADDEQSPSWDLRFRLVNAWPREARPAFDAVRAALAPYGYALSPLHPVADLRRPRMQTDLSRISAGDAQQFAPLVFELERGGHRVRVFVRQFGGRAVPDFVEQWIDLMAPVDIARVTVMLQTYVLCMVRPRLRAAA